MTASWIHALREVVGRKHVLEDAASLLAYESDALTLFRCSPAAVVLPQFTEEVVAIMRILHREKIPCAARGAGTGLSGGALVPEGGVILSMTRMNQILSVCEKSMCAIVQPGVVNLDLSKRVEPLGLRYAPDPASQTVSTLGGNVAENAGGPMCFLHGTTTNHLLGAKVVLSDGSLHDWSTQDDLDLRGFLCGSEGTLGVMVELTLRLITKPKRVVTMLAAYQDVAQACAAVAGIVAQGIRPVALEVMDQKAIQAVERSVYRSGLPQDAGAVLIAEIEDVGGHIEIEQERLEACLREYSPLRLEIAQTDRQRIAIWKGRKGAGGAMGQLAPDSYVMDGVVPRSKLAEVMAFVDKIEEEVGLPVANLFHAGDGNIHPHFAYDARDPKQCEAVEEAGAKILRKCLELGGSLSGEHGIGLEKQHLMREQFGEKEIALMERLRGVFNPENLLNPGKGLPMSRGCSEAFHRHKSKSRA
ncbi:MAG: FAD-binding protein [Planctomycetota bacterium]|nr:FAD-binding protein [Planctomycetota bacterium]MDA1114057.1 FAD-binding protein [Planctomycetota bacterium]